MLSRIKMLKIRLCARCVVFFFSRSASVFISFALMFSSLELFAINEVDLLCPIHRQSGMSIKNKK